MSLELKTAPAAEPVTLAELRSYAKLDDWGDDADLTRTLKASRIWVEHNTGRKIISQVWTLSMDTWPESGRVRLPFAPIIAIDAVRVLSASYVPTIIDPASYRLVKGEALPLTPWPVPGATFQGIEIDFRAGYGVSGADVPEDLRLAVLKLATHWTENPGELTEARSVSAVTEPPRALGLGAILSPYRLLALT